MRPGAREGSAREHEAHRAGYPAEQCRDEAERGGRVAVPVGRDLMQGAEREPALRQVGIERRNTERQGAGFGRKALHTRQQAAQFLHHVGAAARPVAVIGGGGSERHGTALHDGRPY